MAADASYHNIRALMRRHGISFTLHFINGQPCVIRVRVVPPVYEGHSLALFNRAQVFYIFWLRAQQIRLHNHMSTARMSHHLLLYLDDMCAVAFILGHCTAVLGYNRREFFDFSSWQVSGKINYGIFQITRLLYYHL